MSLDGWDGSKKWYVVTGEGDPSEGTTWAEGEVITCGEKQGIIRCKGPVRHIWPIMFHCDRQDCPVCWRRWMAREEERIGERLGWAHRNGAGPERHYVVSFNSIPINNREYARYRSLAVKKCKRLGLSGGVMVPHIKIRRRHGVTLHFHVAAFGNLKYSKVAEDYKRDNILLKYINDIWEVRDLSNYELDHAIKIPGRQTVTWFGIVSTRNIQVTETKSEEPAMCDICGAPVLEERDVTTWDGGFIRNPPHIKYTRIRMYVWRDKRTLKR